MVKASKPETAILCWFDIGPASEHKPYVDANSRMLY